MLLLKSQSRYAEMILASTKYHKHMGQKLKDSDPHAMFAWCISMKTLLIQNTHVWSIFVESVDLHSIPCASLHITIPRVYMMIIWNHSWNLFIHLRANNSCWRIRVWRKLVICLFIFWKRMIDLLLLYVSNIEPMEMVPERVRHDMRWTISYLI